MAEPGSSAPDTLRQSAGQWRAALFGDAGQGLYAVLRGERLPGLAAQLAAAGLGDHDCLVAGALPPATLARAPWLVRLEPAAPFTDWVLGEARGIAPDFGLLLASPARFLHLRTHLRELARARQADGQSFALDWPDPAVLGLLLPRLDAGQRQQVFGTVTQFVLPADGGWAHYRLHLGRLHAQRVELLELAPA